MKMIAAAAMVSLLVGCGGGSSSAPGTSAPVESAPGTSAPVESAPVEKIPYNVENNEGETDLGYYGANLYIGNHRAHQYWRIENSPGADYHTKTNQIVLVFHNSGNGVSAKTLSAEKEYILTESEYGISADAMTIKIDADYDGNPENIIVLNHQVDSDRYTATLTTVSTNEKTEIMFVAADNPDFVILGENSAENCEGQTNLGWYGKEVFIGNHLGNKVWGVTREKTSYDFIIFVLDEHGNESYSEVHYNGRITRGTIQYGVTTDALTINTDLDYDDNSDFRYEIISQINEDTYDIKWYKVEDGTYVNMILMTK